MGVARACRGAAPWTLSLSLSLSVFVVVFSLSHSLLGQPLYYGSDEILESRCLIGFACSCCHQGLLTSSDIAGMNVRLKWYRGLWKHSSSATRRHDDGSLFRVRLRLTLNMFHSGRLFHSVIFEILCAEHDHIHFPFWGVRFPRKTA